MFRFGFAAVFTSVLMAQSVDLTPARLKPIGAASIEQVTYRGKTAIRVTDPSGAEESRLVIVAGVEFEDGVIEYDFAGDVKPNAAPAMRGFTGLAFRVSPDGSRYECFYQRPLNGVSPNAEQRQHTVQYVSMPGYGWQKLRTETPGKYERWADIKPGEWAHVRIEVKGSEARVGIDGKELMSADLKQGRTRGGVALWIDRGTVAHFANLKITR